MNSEILDQLKSCGESGKLPEWGEVAKEVDRLGVWPGGVGKCSKEPRSPSGAKSTSGRDVVFASGPKSCGSRSWDVRSELGT
jgi:hypothetical protein